MVAVARLDVISQPVARNSSDGTVIKMYFNTTLASSLSSSHFEQHGVCGEWCTHRRSLKDGRLFQNDGQGRQRPDELLV